MSEISGARGSWQRSSAAVGGKTALASLEGDCAGERAPVNDETRGLSSRFPVQHALESMATEPQLPSALAFVYLRRMADLGMASAKGDATRFSRAIELGLKTGVVRFPVSQKRIKSAGIDSERFVEEMKRPVSDEEVEAYGEVLGQAVTNTTTRVIEFTSKAHGRYLKVNAEDILEEHRSYRSGFLTELRDVWGLALNKFDVLLGIAREVGEFSLQFMAASTEDGAWSYKQDAMAFLYGRACQVADEISVLLSHGFADGAQARWRSLHEIQVVLRVLAHDDEELSRRYLEHHDIDLYHEAKATISFGNTKVQGITEAEFLGVQRTREELLKEHGEHFDVAYGWASKVLGFKATRFSDIEKLADASYFRPFYKAASANVHASSRGTFTRLGAPDMSEGALAGGSMYGLHRPAVGAVHSLVLAAIDIANQALSPDALAQVMAMEVFGREVASAFESADKASRKSQARSRKKKARFSGSSCSDVNPRSDLAAV